MLKFSSNDVQEILLNYLLFLIIHDLLSQLILLEFLINKNFIGVKYEKYCNKLDDFNWFLASKSLIMCERKELLIVCFKLLG